MKTSSNFRSFRRTATALLLAMLAVPCFWSCKDNNDDNKNKDIAVTGVTVDPANHSLYPGDTKQLAHTVTPAEATVKTVKWTSSNTARATVEDGLVTVPAAASPGEVVITVTTDDGGKTAPCIITVLEEPEYKITASALTSFGSTGIPYEQPVAQIVTVKNIGTDAVTLTQPTATGYDIGTLSPAATIAPQAEATFTVRPKANLPEGVYNETITVSGSNGASATVEATFTVAPVYSISASALTPFVALESPYTPPAAQTVTVTNTGNSAVTLTQPTAVNYEIGVLSTTTLAAEATATFTVRPKANLPVGDYNEPIAISGSNGVSATVNASFKVTGKLTLAEKFQALGGLVGLWEFTDFANFQKGTVGNDLATHNNVALDAIGYPSTAGISSIEGFSSEDGAVFKEARYLFLCDHDIPETVAGSGFVNNWTVVFDLKMPAVTGTAWNAILNTEPTNVSTAGLNEWSIRAGDERGMVLYNSLIIGTPLLYHDTWYRMIFTVEYPAYRIYVNGELVRTGTREADDFKLDARGIGFFSDRNRNNQQMIVSTIGLFNKAITGEEAASLTPDW